MSAQNDGPQTGRDRFDNSIPDDIVFDETIAAVITPPGEGGIAAVRIVGPDSLAITGRLFRGADSKIDPQTPFMLRLGQWLDTTEEPIDEVTTVFMPEGKSYTGLQQVEVFCHGGRQVVKTILESILASGARAAEPGEFTRLAFLNGQLDLAKAEAVAEVIAANTAHSLEASRLHLLGQYSEHIGDIRSRLVKILAEIEASVDFAEEDIDPADASETLKALGALRNAIEDLRRTYTGGRIVREGFKVVIAGRPNAGKSSLFNLLLRQERALVNPSAGTTRDYLSEWIDLEGYPVNLIDTAGLRIGGDEIEQAGQSLARQLISESDLVLWLVDLTEELCLQSVTADTKTLGETPVIVVGNKADLVDSTDNVVEAAGNLLLASCLTGEGLDKLKTNMLQEIERHMPNLTDGLVVTSARHYQKLGQAADALQSAARTLGDGESPEVVAVDVRAAMSALDEITGRIYTEDVLGEIFAGFCIGK